MRVFKSKAFWLLLFSTSATIGYWYISTWDKSMLSNTKLFPYPWNTSTLFTDFYIILLTNKIKIGITWGVIFFVCQASLLYFPISIKRRKFVKNTLSHILNQYMKGNVRKNRITIYVCKRGYQIILKYIWICFIKNFKKHSTKKLIGSYFMEMPRPFKKYLVFAGRTGKPYENGTSTFFPVPEIEHEITGIVPHVFYNNTPDFFELSDISHIPIKNLSKIEDIEIPEHRDEIKEYMKMGMVNSFNKLKMFHRYPLQIYATPIYDKKSEAFGVIVFDSIDKEVDFNKNIDNLLGYCKITENIINYIN